MILSSVKTNYVDVYIVFVFLKGVIHDNLKGLTFVSKWHNCNPLFSICCIKVH